MTANVKRSGITSVDVAKEAGVSQSVVSRAFTAGGKVSPKTRARVLGVAARLGYQPNAMARGLVTQRSNLVGMVVGDSANPFYPQVLARFSERLQALGKQVLLFNVSGDADQALLLALQYRVEAMIVTSATLSSTMSAAFAGSGVPVIFFNRYAEQPGVRAVSCDNVRGGRMVADALLRAGGQRFAFIGGKPDTSTNQGRREGFMTRLKERGVNLELSVEKEYTYEWGYHAARYLLGAGQRGRPDAPIDAVFCANDIVALGVLDALRGSGLRVPAEVAVVGFDDIPAASWPGYALTTVAQPVEEMIDATVKLLGRYDPDTGRNGESEIKLLPGSLIERARACSRGPVSVAAGRVAVVTGAAGGIGSAVCERLARAGFRLVLTYHSREDEAKALADALPGDGHLVVQATVDDSASLSALAEKITAHYGSLELLVNNAGMTRFVAHDDLEALDDALIDQIFRVNWRGAFACVRALRPLLKADGGGVVVNISSLAGVTGEGSNVAYCASKAALDSMTRSLARALAPDIRVVSVSPGLTAGRYTDKLDADWSQTQADLTPLKRLATAEDVAEAVFAVATQLTFSTGCIIPVDGGRPLS